MKPKLARRLVHGEQYLVAVRFGNGEITWRVAEYKANYMGLRNVMVYMDNDYYAYFYPDTKVEDTKYYHLPRRV